MREINRLYMLALLWLTYACGSPDKPAAHTTQAPVAKKIPYSTTLHDLVLSDDYHWLKDRGNPEVLAYLKAENVYTDSMMKHTWSLQEELFEELKGRVKENDESVPVRIDDYLYYTRTEKGKQYSIYCRKKDNPSAAEEILLNTNDLADGKPYFSIGDYEVSPDHQLLAYTTDTTGSEMYTLYVKNLQTGEYLSDQIPGLSYSLEWSADNQSLFYTTQDSAHRPCKLFIHKLGTPYQEDKQEYHEEDERFYLSIDKSKNKDYLLMRLESQTSSEVYILPSDKPHEDFEVFMPRQQNVKYHVYPHKEDFYILTNQDAVNYHLMKVPKGARALTNWQEVVPQQDSATLEQVSVFSEYLAVSRRENGLRRINILDLTTGSWHEIPFQDSVYTVHISENPDFTNKKLRFSYSSPVIPASVYDYNMEEKSRKLLKQDSIPGGYHERDYTCERIFATATDGTKIPVSLVYRKDLSKKESHPLLLYGYGAYGSLTRLDFSSNRLSLLNRGFIYAIAHVRGSGDMGEKWYLDGKLLRKKNTFSDFINCAEHLIDEKYTDSTKLVAMGGSAGGLLMGAVANMKPTLFEAIVALVPFVDVVNTMLDEALPLTVTEYEEWGNPHSKEAFDYIYSYSPYDNVERQNYPNMLITAGLHDSRVSYWEPAKWTARLRAMKTDSNLLLLKTNMEAGHRGSSGRYSHLKDVAFQYAFILDVLGLQGNGKPVKENIAVQ